MASKLKEKESKAATAVVVAEKVPAIIDGAPVPLDETAEKLAVSAIVRSRRSVDAAEARSLVTVARSVYHLEQSGQWFTGRYRSAARLARDTHVSAMAVSNWRVLGRALEFHGSPRSPKREGRASAEVPRVRHGRLRSTGRSPTLTSGRRCARQSGP
jgi:hypothetical protein